jgi:CHAD domain-containing protein
VDFQAITQGLKTTVSRGRTALKSAAATYDPNDFHELRKRGKDLRYQVHFLHKLWPQVFDGYSESAKELEQLLGDDHNLTVMQGLVGEVHLDARANALLRSIIKDRQEDLRAKALDAAKLLYSERWSSWSRRLKKCSQLAR